MRDLILDNSGVALPSLKNIEFLKVVVVYILTFMFTVSVVFIVIWQPENKSLQVLTGLLGLTLGYFVGRTERT